MSAQCRHGLIRYECWQCRDEAKKSTRVAHVFAGGLVTAVQQLEERDADLRRLRQELAIQKKANDMLAEELDALRSPVILSEWQQLEQRAERAEAELAAARALLLAAQEGFDEYWVTLPAGRDVVARIAALAGKDAK